MRTLIVGCGRAREIHYNPLYRPRPGAPVLGPLATAIRERRIVTERLCAHDTSDVITIDIDAMRSPTFVCNVINAAELRDTVNVERGEFDEIKLESFPYTALVNSQDCGLAFFQFCKHALKGNGRLTITTGNGVTGENNVKLIEDALTGAGFRVIESVLKNPGPAGYYRFVAVPL